MCGGHCIKAKSARPFTYCDARGLGGRVVVVRCQQAVPLFFWMRFFLCHVVSSLVSSRPPYSSVHGTKRRRVGFRSRRKMEEDAVTERTTIDYEEMEAEYSACQQQLQSKEQALRILQGQLKKADLATQRLKQEMKQLRSQLSRSQQISSPVSPTGAGRVIDSNGMFTNEDLIREKEKLIQELEQAHWQIGNLERQVEQLNDEKENLADEKLHYVSKYESLVKLFEEEKKRQPPSVSTVQRVLDENKELQLALVEANAGKDHFKSRVEKIKDAMQRKKSIESASEQAASPDRKVEFKTARRIAELESLAKNLTESVKVKSVTISHQKRANKMLATDLARLQHRMNMWEATCSCGIVSARNSRYSSPAEDTGTQRKLTNGGEGVALGRQVPNGGVALGRQVPNGGVALDRQVPNSTTKELVTANKALDRELAAALSDRESATTRGTSLEGYSPEPNVVCDEESVRGGGALNRKSSCESASSDTKLSTGSKSPDRKSSIECVSSDKAVLCNKSIPGLPDDQDAGSITIPNGSQKT